MWPTSFEARTSSWNKALYFVPTTSSKTDCIDEYIKAMQEQIALLKSEVILLRGEVKERNVFIEQLNNINNNNNNNFSFFKKKL